MKTPEDIGDAMECMGKLRAALQLMLDHVDYTDRACEVNDMVGACLPENILTIAHEAIKYTD